MNTKRETLDYYLQILEDTMIISKCSRFDGKSRKSLQDEQKYDLADLSFYFAPNIDNRINYGPVLENIVSAYAKSKGRSVSVGRIGKLECDFILRTPEMSYAYIQVAMTIINSWETEDREYRPIEMIRDNYPKFIAARNDPIQHRNGIVHENMTEPVGRKQGLEEAMDRGEH